MKNKSFCLLCVLVFAILLSGCATVTVFDKDVPPEKAVKLLPYAGFIITSYNGISVELKKAPILSYELFSFPAGKAEIGFDIINGQLGNLWVTKKNNSFTYNFEAGKEYSICLLSVDKEGKVKFVGAGETYIAFALFEGKFSITNTTPVLSGRLFEDNESNKKILN